MYSMDKDANENNPWTPSAELSLSDQFLYRFSRLEEAVRSGFTRVDENIAALRNEFHDRNLDQVQRVTTLESKVDANFAFKRARIDALEKRIIELETWSKVLTARLAIALAAVIMIWTFIAPILRNIVGLPGNG